MIIREAENPSAVRARLGRSVAIDIEKCGNIASRERTRNSCIVQGRYCAP
jgi:hypothetical protein